MSVRNVKKREPSNLENSMEATQKIKNRTNIRSSNSTPGYIYISEENENINSKRSMYTNVHRSNMYNSQDMEAT